ncbi:MAG: GatB/YqeY domain-containing protein [Parvibaculales bacterium]
MRDDINQALKEAIKSKSSRRASTLRLIVAAIKDRDIAARGADKVDGVSDDEILEILSKMVKQRVEAAHTYKEAGREELAAQELEEIDIIQGFLPRQLSDEEAHGAVAKVIADLGASGLKDMGKVMGELKARHTGEMDFGKASGLVKELLG